mgnify:CR=1 FL=1
MKKHLLILSFILIVAMVVAGVSHIPAAYAAETGNKITVTGVGEIKLVPDTAKIILGVETKNSDLVAAEKENSEKITTVINLLTNGGIEKNKIQTRNYSIYPVYDYSKLAAELTGYQVSNRVEFTTKDIEGLGSLISGLTASGANTFSGISFYSEENDAAYNKALELAYANAEQKAASLLGENADFRLIELCEESGGNYQIMYDSYALKAERSTTIMQGEINVTARVKAVFEIL